MRQAERRLLLDVGDLGAEVRAVAGRLPDLLARLGGNDHADLGDSSLDQRLDPVEEHGLVRDRHELLGRGMRDRAQTRPGSPRENQPLELFHAGRRLATKGPRTEQARRSDRSRQ